MSNAKWTNDPIAVEIHDLIEARLELGQERFGPWKTNDGIGVDDILEESCDQLIYAMRLLIKIKHILHGAKHDSGA